MSRNDIIIFCGPTITATEGSDYLKAEFLPPAEQGDVYKYYKAFKPKIIGLIDGYFENRPSPWHKEILYVMSQGVHVFGASSMGALRASELYPYGMVGVGKIFNAYKDNILLDDDEVAVLHSPADLFFMPISEAMVNIRHTLDLAHHESIIDDGLKHAMTNYAKSLFYKKRNYGALIKHFSQNPDYHHQINLFAKWIINNTQNLKKMDAIMMLKDIKDFSQHQIDPMKVDYYFESTLSWAKMRDEIDNMTTQTRKQSI